MGGETERLSVRLELLEETRTVRGRIVTESGGPLKNMSVHLSLVDSPSSVWRASWERDRMCGTGVDHFVMLDAEDGQEVGRFEFERVPAGPVKVTTWGWSAPAVVHVTESADGDLELVVRQIDVDEGPGFGFRVVERDSGAELSSYRVQTRVLDGGPPLYEYARSGRIVSRAAPWTRRLEWAVVAKGYRTVYGTHASFVEEGEGRFFASVALERGWRTRVLVTDPDGRPVVGAAVSVSDELAGVTDSSGRLELERDSSPVRIVATYLDWHTRRAGAPGAAWTEIVLARPDVP